MALDGAMLELSAQLQQPIVRVYQWSEPTVSLGYFQTIADYQEHACSAAPGLVRRATGGGAIVHDNDWTYSIAVPDGVLAGWIASSANASSESAAVGPSQVLYTAMHDAVVSWMGKLGVSALKFEARQPAKPSRLEPFLCFLRRSEGDVLARAASEGSAVAASASAKIMGSAQRRGRGALLQHGSLLLSSSRFAAELPGVLELAGVKLEDSRRTEFTEHLVDSLLAAFSARFAPIELDDIIALPGKKPLSWDAALRLHADQRFDDQLWTNKR